MCSTHVGGAVSSTGRTTTKPTVRGAKFSPLRVVKRRNFVYSRVLLSHHHHHHTHTLYSIAKLASLLVKSLAKPVSKRIKHEFSRYPPTYALLHKLGQVSHQLTSRLTIWSAGYKVRSITALPEDKAVQIGSELVGESFILAVSAMTVLYEYNRGREKDAAKAEAKRAEAATERRELQRQLHALDVRLKALETFVVNASYSSEASSSSSTTSTTSLVANYLLEALLLQPPSGTKKAGPAAYQPPNPKELVPIPAEPPPPPPPPPVDDDATSRRGTGISSDGDGDKEAIASEPTSVPSTADETAATATTTTTTTAAAAAAEEQNVPATAKSDDDGSDHHDDASDSPKAAPPAAPVAWWKFWR